MSESPTETSRSGAQQAPARVRPATSKDAAGVASAVSALLVELANESPPLVEMERTAHALIEDPDAGIVLLAECDGAIVGVIVASLQTAIHVPGRYALIQDLWVDPAWRSRAIGRSLMDALCEIAADRGLARLEVGLPKEGFPQLLATTSFYLTNDFAPLGPRMRRLLR